MAKLTILSKNYLPFPTDQKEMTRYKKEYEWDPVAKKWYKPTKESTAEPEVISALGERFGMSSLSPLSREVQLKAMEDKIKKIASSIAGLVKTTGTAFTPSFKKQFPEISALKTEEKFKTPEKIETPAIKELVTPSETISPAELIEKFGATKIRKEVEDLMKEFKESSRVPITEKVEELLPSVPQRVKDIDTQLAKMRTSYELGMQKIEDQPIPMPLIIGQQRSLQRQYEIKRQGLLREREALMGDYDRAVERTKLILDLEREQREEQREAQKMAIKYLMERADEAERRALEAYNYALDRQAELEDRIYKEKQREIEEIERIVSRTPEAFVGKEWPKTLEKALQIEGEYLVKEKEEGEGGFIGTKALFQDLTTGKKYDLGTITGLKEFKADHPEYTYEDMNAWMDTNLKLDAKTREGLLKRAGYMPLEEEEKEEEEVKWEDLEKESSEKSWWEKIKEKLKFW